MNPRGQDQWGFWPREPPEWERVCAGVRAAKAKGTRLGRPQRVFRRDEALRLRNQGMSWRKVARALNLPMSTVIDACRPCSENPLGRWRQRRRKHNPLPTKRLPFDKHMISERVQYRFPRSMREQVSASDAVPLSRGSRARRPASVQISSPARSAQRIAYWLGATTILMIILILQPLFYGVKIKQAQQAPGAVVMPLSTNTQPSITIL